MESDKPYLNMIIIQVTKTLNWFRETKLPINYRLHNLI